MGLIRTCKICGKTKELHGNYRMHKRIYSDICKECESDHDDIIRQIVNKANLKKSLFNSWNKLSCMMDEKELDQVLFNLKQIYYNQKHQ